MNLLLTTVDCDPATLDKSGYFTDGNTLTLTVEILEPINLLNPTFILSNTNGLGGYNYAYAAAFDRYYFLGAPEIIDGGRCAISGTCDVLTSNADGIKALKIAVNRAGKNVNRYMMDRLRPNQTNRQCETLNFKNSFSPVNFSTDICYILTTQGGAHT